MKNTDILIIGAGAAGLMAARALTKSGKSVVLLEARNRIGGRIHTLKNADSSTVIELGAEFIHGDLPLTKALLDEAGIAYHNAAASMWKYEDGRFTNNGTFIENIGELLEKLNALEEDMTINSFLKMEFDGDKYEGLRESVRQFVCGYDNADPDRASAVALLREWQSESEEEQYRVDGGYSALINFLVDEFTASGGEIYLNKVVTLLKWQQHQVTAVTDDGITYEAKQVLIAAPLGVLQAKANEKGAINFEPLIQDYKYAINALGFGAVIKLLLHFDEAFWESVQTEKLADNNLKDMGYLFSSEEIPTWWTQMPARSATLTGWLGGPDALAQVTTPDEEILKMGLKSLQHIFNVDSNLLKEKLLSWKVANWTADAFARGSYAYDTVEATASRKILNTPIKETIFFAGEYLYEGAAIGTVEAALTSGLKAAERMISEI